MKEKNIVIFSLAGFFISLAILFVYVNNMAVPYVKIGEINTGNGGSIANITGTVKNLRESGEGHLFFYVKDESGEIKAVIWESQLKKLESQGIEKDSIKNGARITIVGEIQLYRGEFEIIPVRNSVSIIS